MSVRAIVLLSPSLILHNIYFPLQMDYINTSHPNFVGGSKAVEIAQQQIKSSKGSLAMPRQKVCLLCKWSSALLYPLFDFLLVSSVVKMHWGARIGTPGEVRWGPIAFISLRRWVSMKRRLGERLVCGWKVLRLAPAWSSFFLLDFFKLIYVLTYLSFFNWYLILLFNLFGYLLL
jgi:hypothetical protein